MIQVIESRFLTSADNAKNAPAPQDSEIVCLGRSNVGKSTLLNALLHKNLAKSSSTPGKTQLINFFISLWQVGEQNVPLTFIDLPGFGYAKVSKSTKQKWEQYLFDFILSRSSIKLFLHLIDARHTHLDIDSNVREMLMRICRGDQYVMPIYTKADKLTQNDINKLIAHKQPHINIESESSIESKPSHKPQPPILFSATKKHHKFTSIQNLREMIVSRVLGLNDGI